MGIHYDYKSTRGAKAMEKQAKREKKLADKKAKRDAKKGFSKAEEDKSIPLDQVITLDHLTNPEKKQLMNPKKDKIRKLELALRKNLKKRKTFQKKIKKNNK